jgi:hypothetical protein
LKIAEEKKEELNQYFSKYFISEVRKNRELLDTIDITKDKEDREDREDKGNRETIYPLGESLEYENLWSSLWFLCEEHNVGVEVEFSKIPLRQETIEICQYFNLNPYKLSSKGCYLIITREPENLVLELKEMGLSCEIIGKTTEEKAKILKRGDYIRHLPRPGK